MTKKKKSVADVKEMKKKKDNEPLTIVPGNASILTVKLLDTIAQTLLRIEKKLDG
jgi:hypothetical protein